MSGDEKKRRDAELDAFWDIDALIPRRTASHTPRDTETTEVVLEPIEKSPPADPPKGAVIPPREDTPKRHFIPPHTEEEESQAPTPEKEYTPENALVRRVCIYRWKSNYRYYESFVRDAVKLYPVKGGACARVPFFSYVPQYSQMSREQLEWYLYWRDRLRSGEFLDTDYSYVLLYVYELINLSDRLEPLFVQDALCKVWVHYRALYRQLDHYLSEWICDHSLLHGLPPPAICTGELLQVVMLHCGLKEFFLPEGNSDSHARALLTFCSNYDYRKSKFYTEENKALFDQILSGALCEVTRSLSANGKLFATAGMDDSTRYRDAYTGALCSYRIKRRIKVEYCSFSRTHELRYFITDVVKHTENRLRGVIGVRSRLSIYALPVAVRKHLDAYLDSVLPTKRTTSSKREEQLAEYERLYDLPRTELSLSSAAAIEHSSWETTQRLVEAFEEVTDEVQPNPIKAEKAWEPSSPVAEKEHITEDPWQSYRPFLAAALEADFALERSLAGESGTSQDLIADEINTLAADLFGDILLEELDGGYGVMEDYVELVQALLGKED